MGRDEIYNFFDQNISKKAIQNIDDEWQVVGKWCRIAIEENDVIDIWLCNPIDIATGLGTRKLRTLILALNSTVEGEFRELTGEAYTKTSLKDSNLLNLNLLGIRKKRIISDECQQKLTHGLAKFKNKNTGV